MGRTFHGSDPLLAVVGGGIGGLVAALALRRVGFEDVTVLERAGEIREVGAALTLWSNALRALARLGLDGPVRDAGTEVRVGRLREPSGRVLVETPVADVSRELGAPSVCLHRADLQAILVAAVREARIPLRLGVDCRSVDFGPPGAMPRLLFSDRRELSAAVVIGADGLRSVVRAAILGDLPPRYSGYTCWRAIAAFPRPGIEAGEAFETWGPGSRFGAIRVDADRVYWFASENAPPGGRDGIDPKRELLDRFGAWHEPIAALVESTPAEAIQRLDVLDRKPSRRIGRGLVTLLGDAAHPTTPNLGQGACLAIEDAIVLADCLAADPMALERGLRAYEARRRARTAAVVRRSYGLGSVGQLSSPFLCRMRNAIMRRLPERMMRRSFADVLARGIDE